MATILVPDYLGQHVRAGIRLLNMQGDVCDLAWGGCRVKSRYIRDFHHIIPSREDDRGYISDVIELCDKRNYDFILPFGNSSYYAVSCHADKLRAQGIKFMVADFDIFDIAHDKHRTIGFCRKIGIRTPELFTDYSDNDVKAIANHVRYPVVIKARSGVGVATGLRYANTKEELVNFYEEISSQEARTGASDFESPMIQEFVPGFIHDACTLTAHGKVLAILTQRRHIMYPIYGGVGAVNVTTHDRTVRDLARHILEELKWHGPAQIEFKYDPRDKQYKFIEMNPKFWGTLDLSIKVGVDFPRMVRDFLMGKQVDGQHAYPAGVRYKFMFSQATFAYLQIIKEFGVRHTFDPVSYAKTHYDFDWNDLRFDLYRVLSVAVSILRKKYRAPNDNISKELINRI